MLNVEPVAGGAIGKASHLPDTGETPHEAATGRYRPDWFRRGEMRKTWSACSAHGHGPLAVANKSDVAAVEGKIQIRFVQECALADLLRFSKTFTNHTKKLRGDLEQNNRALSVSCDDTNR